MYYLEEIINGVLCFKTFPNGAWHTGKQTITAEDFVSLVKLAENFIQSL